MKVLRTPDDRFLNLPDYDFAPRYVDIDEMRMHYVDQGPADAQVVLLLHGEPSWSYLYRHMIPPIASAGLRAIAPDLIGFGKSDKPAAQKDYSYEKHVAWMKQFLVALNLQAITLVCQDWGSLIGLRLAAEDGERFDRIVLANGGLPIGEQVLPAAFRIWRAFARFSPWFPIGRIVQYGTISRLSPEVVAAYDAPFPTSAYKPAARAFPKLVPTSPDDPAAPANRAAWEAYGNWQKPFLTSFSDRDPITRGLDKAFLQQVPGSKGQSHGTIRDAGHFLQEDKGLEFARVVIDFIENSYQPVGLRGS
jgi:haloalkane dehalogenase